MARKLISITVDTAYCQTTYFAGRRLPPPGLEAPFRLGTQLRIRRGGAGDPEGEHEIPLRARREDGRPPQRLRPHGTISSFSAKTFFKVLTYSAFGSLGGSLWSGVADATDCYTKTQQSWFDTVEEGWGFS